MALNCKVTKKYFHIYFLIDINFSVFEIHADVNNTPYLTSRYRFNISTEAKPIRHVHVSAQSKGIFQLFYEDKNSKAFSLLR